MKGYQDRSRLFVLAACVSLESLLSSGSVLLLRWRDISPNLSLAREIAAIQTFTVSPSFTTPL